MAGNVTENILAQKEEYYRDQYNILLDMSINNLYSIVQCNCLKNPVKYVKLLSADKSAGINPALHVREQMQKVLMAMWSVNMSFHMIIHYDGSSVNIYVGTVCPEGNTCALSELMTVLAGSIGGVSFDKQAGDVRVYLFDEFKQIYQKEIGYFYGNPTVRDYIETELSVTPIDELISGSGGRDWIFCINAVPVPKRETADLRTKWYNDLAESGKYTDVSFGYGAVGNNRSMNLSEQYVGTHLFNELARKYCSELDEAAQYGEWYAGAFCTALSESSRDIFGAIFSAQMKSGAEQIQRPFPFEYHAVSSFKFNPSLQFPNPNSCMRLTSRELAALSALPVKDTCGFNVEEQTDFDVYRAATGALSIGNIVNGNYITSSEYRLELDTLNRHGLITGLTGGGKTNTVKALLHSLHELNCPFMVIEPAKKEYYDIYNMRIYDLCIYTVGSSEGCPLFINPFEPAGNVSLQSHIDAVFAAFKASFIMYTPMPYILENAIYEIYGDYGWDIETGINRYGRNDYPTVEDLYYKIGPVVREMGYDERMQNDLVGSLKARINSLRVGAKGKTLNTMHSVKVEKLLEGNTIVELDDVNDEEAKAFIISLLLLQIQECRRMQADSQLKVRHILLIEEAHRLLKNVSSGTGENADPRGNAVEFFCNMLAELRSKGQGFLVIDQSPSKLASDLVKNTNLKIIHRTVASEDRHFVGSAMNMTEEQENYLSRLKQGYAAVYSESDSRPKLVKLPYAGRFETTKLGRREILNKTALNCSGNSGVVNDAPRHVNPICRHCRKCTEMGEPLRRFDSDQALSRFVMGTFTLPIHDAYRRINGRFGVDSEWRRCAAAAWFKANEAGSIVYSDYARVTDFMIKEFFSINK